MRTIDLTDIHVLIVDDHDDMLDVLSAALQQFGATVLRARTGRAALTIVMTVRVNAIVSDLAMPGEDGLWLVQQLRRLNYDKGGIVPAIAVTARPDHYGAEQAKVAGFDAFLAKPVDPFDLSRALASLVGR